MLSHTVSAYLAEHHGGTNASGFGSSASFSAFRSPECYILSLDRTCDMISIFFVRVSNFLFMEPNGFLAWLNPFQ
jgi:hypothetical protein